MKIYKRRGCLPSRFISKTKVETPRSKEVAIHPFRSIQASKNGKKTVPGWPTEGNRARDYTETAQRSNRNPTEIVQESYRKLTERKHAENPQRELPKRSGRGNLQQYPTGATHGGNSRGQFTRATHVGNSRSKLPKTPQANSQKNFSAGTRRFI